MSTAEPSPFVSGFELVGPFQEWRVVVEGRRVPLLTAEEVEGGRLNLIFDDRIGVLLDIATAESVIPFIADVIKGCLNFKHGWPIMLEIGEVHANADDPEDAA